MTRDSGHYPGLKRRQLHRLRQLPAVSGDTEVGHWQRSWLGSWPVGVSSWPLMARSGGLVVVDAFDGCGGRVDDRPQRVLGHLPVEDPGVAAFPRELFDHSEFD